MKLLEAIKEVPRKDRKSITVGRLAKLVTKAQIKTRIQVAYRAMNAAIHDLLREKKAAGLCTLGISCMKQATHGNGCALHHAIAAQQRENRANGEYVRKPATEYARIRKEEREAESYAKAMKRIKAKRKAA